MLQRLNGNSYEDSVTLIIILNGMTDSINPAYRRHCILGCLRIIAQIPTHAKTFSKKKMSCVTCHMSHVTCHTSAYDWPSQVTWHVGHKTCIGQWRKKVMCFVSHVKSHMPHGTCHSSPVTHVPLIGQHKSTDQLASQRFRKYCKALVNPPG